jgi:hypothetical protein
MIMVVMINNKKKSTDLASFATVVENGTWLCRTHFCETASLPASAM